MNKTMSGKISGSALFLSFLILLSVPHGASAGSDSLSWDFQCSRHGHNDYQNCGGREEWFPRDDYYAAAISFQFLGHRHGGSGIWANACVIAGGNGECQWFTCTGSACGYEYGGEDPWNLLDDGGITKFGNGRARVYYQAAVKDAEVRVVGSGSAEYADYNEGYYYGEGYYYAQGAYYSQGSYSPGYSQGSYYGQGSYSPGYSQGSYSPGYSQGAYYSQGSYYSQGAYYAQGSYVPPASSAPTVSGLPSCTIGPYQSQITLSWSGTANPGFGFYVDIDDEPGYGSFYNKQSLSQSTDGNDFKGIWPSQSDTLSLQPGIRYYARVYNGNHSPTTDWTVPLCTKRVCQVNACAVVPGLGSDECSSNGDCAPVCTSFTASPDRLVIPPPATSLLSWSCERVSSCTISGVSGSFGGSGSVTVAPTSTTTYTLNCRGENAALSASRSTVIRAFESVGGKLKEVIPGR